MNGPVPSAAVAAVRRSGPQGTRLFRTEELRRHAIGFASEYSGHATTAKPVMQGRSLGLEKVRYTLRSGRQTIGRRNDNDIVVGDLSVSASHAWVINQQGHYVIMNTLSTNGTFVNDKRVHEAILKHGDRIRLGQAEFEFLTREKAGGGGWRGPLLAAGLIALAALAGLAWWLI